ncbi:hypothetical protein KJ068_08805 [bacterium]|nr:hypothetical protein [bacterium]
MKSYTTERFRKAFVNLPESVQRQAKDAYSLFLRNHHHPSLHFKPIHPTKPIYSVRINIDYRAVGVLENAEIVWFWIGTHAEYDKLIKRL